MHGLGGVGKTQIAAEFAYRHINDYSLIGWIEAQRTELIPGDLSPLAPYLDVQPQRRSDRHRRGGRCRAVPTRHVMVVGL